jgi:predicted AAA+ superfamily ATPase
MNNLAIETGVDNKTISSWIGVLESSFIIFRLYPHHRNFNKRIVKMAKIYFYDTGLICNLLGLQSAQQLDFYPLYGSLFENFVISELVKHRHNRAKTNNLYFWRDNIGHEIDIIAERTGNLFPIEIKSGKTITEEFFKGMHYWLRLSGVKSGAIVYAGGSDQIRSNIRIVPWNKISSIDIYS